MRVFNVDEIDNPLPSEKSPVHEIFVVKFHQQLKLQILSLNGALFSKQCCLQVAQYMLPKKLFILFSSKSRD